MKVNKKQATEPFTCVGSSIKDVPAPRVAQAAWAALCRFRNSKTNEARPALATLATMCRVSAKTVRNAITDLEELGLVSVQYHHMSCCVYTLKFDKNRYFTIPNRVFDTDIPTIAKVYWMELCSFAKAKYECYRNRKNAAKACGMSLSSVDRARRKLEELGIIGVDAQVSSQGCNVANRFVLLLRCGTAALSARAAELVQKYAVKYEEKRRNRFFFTQNNRISVLHYPRT